MNLWAWSGLLTGISSLIFGIFVFLKNRKNKMHQIFLLFALSVAIYGFGVYKAATAIESQAALFWWRVMYSGVIFIPIFFLHFTYLFLGIKKRKIIIASYLLGLFFLAINYTNLFMSKVQYEFSSMYYLKSSGFLYPFFVFLWVSLVFFSHYKLYIALREHSAIRRAQIKYFFLAMAIGFSGGATSYLPIFNINIYPYLNFTVALYPAIMAYAIITHRLMDIKMVMRRYSVYLVSLISILIPALAIKYLINFKFYYLTNWVDIILLVLSISVFSPIKHFYYRVANKYFFSSLYSSQEVIASLSDRLRSTLEIRKIYQTIYNTLNKAFHIKSFSILTYDEDHDNYIVKYNKHLDFSKKKYLSSKDLSKLIMKKNEPIVIGEVKNYYYNKKTKAIINLLVDLNIEIIHPLSSKDKIIGLLVFGPKESGDMYNDEDLRVLKVIGAQAAIAIENAILYRETLDFNIKLTEEIEKATHELKRANRKLRKLDQAKSDFISIASHQLRTPLTVIKGYISMILEGNFGKLNKSQENSLAKVLDSGERLIQIVENLLNISRIESGRLKFDYKNIQLEDIVSSVVEDLLNYSRKKGLNLSYKKPTSLLPKVNIDEGKVRQVIMNLIDNAIKYSSKGEVEVSLMLREKNIRFCVEDDGVGIKEGDLNTLFKKFSRGSGTSVIHTEGTGLGLYVAKQIINFHNGKIWAESEGEGKGSKFCFELPVK